jgi:DNA polymerase-3 subunit epsilon
VNDSGRVFSELNAIIKPIGFTIPKEASDIHGITNEIANECGVPLMAALWCFQAICRCADVIVAHNIEFDSLVTEVAFARAEMDPAPLRGKVFHCTMNAMTDVCMIPGPYGYKWPRLEEAYRHLFGEWNIKAHDAMEDVRACARIYLHNLNNKVVAA